MVSINGSWVEFKFYRPGANQVHLVGDFNHWQHKQLSMVQDEAGYWFARLKLPAGEFKFRYNADGAWFTDYAAFGVEPGLFGMDSVVRVPQQTLRIVQPQTQSQPAVAVA